MFHDRSLHPETRPFEERQKVQGDVRLARGTEHKGQSEIRYCQVQWGGHRRVLRCKFTVDIRLDKIIIIIMVFGINMIVTSWRVSMSRIPCRWIIVVGSIVVPVSIIIISAVVCFFVVDW